MINPQAINDALDTLRKGLHKWEQGVDDLADSKKIRDLENGVIPSVARIQRRLSVGFERASILRAILLLEDAIEKCPRTKDGELIGPDTVLWQIDAAGFVNDGHPWRCGVGFTFQNSKVLPVFSSKEAAIRSVNVPAVAP